MAYFDDNMPKLHSDEKSFVQTTDITNPSKALSGHSLRKHRN